MKLIVALGNIGDKYCFTRHNVGFIFADMWSINNGFSFKQESKLKCYLAKFKFNNEDIILIKPTTYMNLSGEAVSLVMNYYKIDVKDVFIVFDDLNLSLGTIRFKANGSDGGHNGIKSIVQHAGTNKIARLKIGIGPQPPIPSEAFVLQNFAKDQEKDLKDTLKKSIEAMEYCLTNGIEKAQNQYN